MHLCDKRPDIVIINCQKKKKQVLFQKKNKIVHMRRTKLFILNVQRRQLSSVSRHPLGGVVVPPPRAEKHTLMRNPDCQRRTTCAKVYKVGGRSMASLQQPTNPTGKRNCTVAAGMVYNGAGGLRPLSILRNEPRRTPRKSIHQ